MNRVKLLILLPIIVTIGVLVIMNTEGPKPQKNHEIQSRSTSLEKPSPLGKRRPEAKAEKAKKPQFSQKSPGKKSTSQASDSSFEVEVEKVRALARRLPASRKQLVKIITSEDPLRGKEIKPHSIAEIQQNKMGAVKVLALKALMKLKDRKVLEENLGEIVATAKDPTIRKIAQAAKDSLDQGRSFLDDFPEAVLSL